MNLLVPTRSHAFPAAARLVVLLGAFLLLASVRSEDGAAVVVIYNTKMPESRQVAEYYAQRRHVPTNQIFGFNLPESESMTRADFLEHLQTPLLKKLTDGKLFTFGPGPKPPGAPPSEPAPRVVLAAKIRYAALCYGVPTKILRDDKLVEEGVDKIRPELRRNEASVDSQLAALPLAEQKLLWAGPLVNRLYGVTNAGWLHPTNGLLLVARLDGPSAAIARGLVDKALEAETNGLWGRAYFDAGYSINNSNYALGDEWIRGAAKVATMMGCETELDEKLATFSAAFPMSQIAFYAGWYDFHVSGPFARPTVEFMPGAFAYHLHSFSAATIRSTTLNWVGPLLARGATATMGSVDEPYLGATPDITAFMARFTFFGFSFGEAAWACQNSVSWQNLAVGDPLYRPFGRTMAEQHFDLEKRTNNLIEWSHLRVVSRNQANGAELGELISYLEKTPVLRQSAVLLEKLADLYWMDKKLFDALHTYEAALKQHPSPQQKIRLTLRLAERRAFAGPEQKALDLYEQFLKDFPDYPDLLGIYQKMLSLAQHLEKKDTVELCEREIKRLTPSPPAKP